MKKAKAIEKAKKATTVDELIHHFVHRVHETESRSGYSYIHNELWYNSTPICKRFDNWPKKNKSTFIINDRFDRTGAFGNGYSHFDITKAIIGNKNFYSLLYNKLHNVTILDSNTILDICKYVVFLQLETIFTVYASKLRLLTSKDYSHSYRLDHYSDKDTKETIRDIQLLCKTYGITYHNLIKDNLVKTNEGSKYLIQVGSIGWNTPIYETLDLSRPISFWLKPNKWFNKKEQEIINFKLWKYKIHTKLINFDLTFSNFTDKTYSEIYNNKELLKLFETKLEDRTSNIESAKLLAKQKASEKLEKESKERIESWLNGELIRLPHSLPVYLRFRRYRQPDTSGNDHPTFTMPLSWDTDNIETSLGVTVPTTHAELLYRIFKKCKETNTEFVANGHSISIGVYKVEYIKQLGDNWYLKAGCHNIRDIEIEDFVKRNNLNW